ncbi:MAG: hypothetical protein KC478_04485, partial [Bacteriovoracaceae bacterium]|nr:hypothetical protein [Bacteriovoracaceae bacterium]
EHIAEVGIECVFQGLEYDSSENCADTNTLTHSLNAKADQEEYLSIAVCRREAQAILQGLSSASRMRMCAQRASLNISEIELPKEINKDIVHYNIQNTGRNFAPNANFEIDLEGSYNKLFEELSAKMQAGETDCRQIRDYSRKRDKRYSAQAFLSSSFTFSPRSDINEYSISACEMFVELEDLSNTEKLRNSFKKVVPTLNSEK